MTLFKIETFKKAKKKSAYANIKIFKLVSWLLCAIIYQLVVKFLLLWNP